MEEETLRWVRIKTRHSSSDGPWEFREVYVPTKLNKPSRAAELDEWFRENLAPEINYELNTDSEHWRGISWEFVNPPRHRVANRIKNIRERIRDLKATVARYTAELSSYKEQEEIKPNKPRCRLFPDCGCIRQFKHEDCREPYQHELEYIAAKDARREKKS